MKNNHRAIKTGLLLVLSLIACSCKTELQVNPESPKTAEIPGNRSILNGDFSSGNKHWYLLQDDKAEATFVIEGNASKISITNPGKQKWSITLANSTGVVLEKGHNDTLSFSARSNSSERIYVSMSMSKEPYYGYSGFRVLEENPPKHKEELLATWKQITEYYKDYPDHLYFDIMNEPYGNLDNYWNDYAIELYDIIREISPDRPLIISGIYWAHMSHLTQLDLPERILQDPNVLIQFHPYVPGDFCFQGSAGNGRDQLEGIRWRGTEEEKAYIRGLMDSIDTWAAEKGLRLYNGEFTAIASGGSLLEDRLRWMRFITDECEKRNIPWNYYDFSGDECYVYDIATGQWNEEVMGALFD